MAIDRTNFAHTWLKPANANPAYNQFTHHPLREAAGKRAEILVALTQAVVDHHSHLSRIRNWIETLGFTETKAELDKQLTLGHNTKMGNFGEVVASEALMQLQGYSMPLFKLRYRDGRLPMRGEDIIAFRVDLAGQIDLLVVGEAKAYAKYSTQPVRAALERLNSSYKPHPQTLNLIAEVLYGMKRDDEAKAIDGLIARLGAGQVQQEHWIVFLTGDAPADPFGCINAPRSGPPLICIDLPLENITQLVDEVFTPSIHWEVPNGA